MATDKKATRTMSKVTLRKGYLAVVKERELNVATVTLEQFDDILKDEIVAEQMTK
jgi:hypothetical protein